MLKLDEIKKIILEHNIEIEQEEQFGEYNFICFKTPQRDYIAAGICHNELLIIASDYTSDYIYIGTDDQCFLKKLNELLEAKV